MSEWLHPAAPYLAGAVLLAVAPGAARRVLLVAAPALALGLAWVLPDGARSGGSLMGLELTWLSVDPLARVFAIIFALIGGLGAVYGMEARRRRLHAAAFVAAGAALGIALAGDWLTLYVAWETLALASWVLVADGGTARAWAAAFRYLLVHVAGGACLLAGIAWHRAAGGGASLGDRPAGGAAVLILLAFAVNAAIPPLHAWLTDAYPESSPAGGVFLSAFATKAAVYALARVFPGEEVLVWAGVAMALYGVIFAVLENDIRRLLAYHIVSQVGYMVAGVGLGTPLALSGAAAHAFSHILYKALLFMGAGAVLHATGRQRLTELGGLGRAMPATCALYMVGAFSISGAPLLNGFVSKSLVVAAAAAEHRWIEWLGLMLASVGTFLHTGLKLPYFTFAGPDRGLRPAPLPRSMLVAMTVTAGLCAATGIFPGVLYRLLPFPVAYEPYTAGHVLEALQLLLGTAIGFVWLRAKLGGEPTITLDTDRLYRASAAWIARDLAPSVAGAAAGLERRLLALTDRPLGAAGPGLGPPLGYAVLLAVAILGVVLLAAFALDR
ncbi:MAG: Na(+)/H(+) antiporter subunit D [Candidatus Rokubacteria bacterium]|nr:Na(+)/H(+) antiporter subunit D [Candidatus Rokubacteria bacterium]